MWARIVENLGTPTDVNTLSASIYRTLFDAKKHLLKHSLSSNSYELDGGVLLLIYLLCPRA
jgi:hypothetical protein